MQPELVPINKPTASLKLGETNNAKIAHHVEEFVGAITSFKERFRRLCVDGGLLSDTGTTITGITSEMILLSDEKEEIKGGRIPTIIQRGDQMEERIEQWLQKHPSQRESLQGVLSQLRQETKIIYYLIPKDFVTDRRARRGSERDEIDLVLLENMMGFRAFAVGKVLENVIGKVRDLYGIPKKLGRIEIDKTNPWFDHLSDISPYAESSDKAVHRPLRRTVAKIVTEIWPLQ